jgi:uncharacterized SAM-binding protein YcdF (DUF218 family)
MTESAVILGGGMTPEGRLTDLSKQRLNAGISLYKLSRIKRIVVLGGHKSTYFANAIEFDLPGSQIKARYLIEAGIPETAIDEISDGLDTIGEAIACRQNLPRYGITHFMLVTSELHMPRAQWIFSAVLGGAFGFESYPVPCGNILIEAEEEEYLAATKRYFNFGRNFDFNRPDWHGNNQPLYEEFARIHDVYHPPGHESRAYAAVSSEKPVSTGKG